MSGNKLVLPQVLSSSRGRPKVADSFDESYEDAGPESFNGIEVATQPAKQTSIDESELSPLEDNRIHRARRRGATLDGTSHYGLRSVPPRSWTINLAGLARSRTTGRPTPVNASLQAYANTLPFIDERSVPASEHSLFQQPRTASLPPLAPEEAIGLQKVDLENASVPRSLDNFSFPCTKGVQNTNPIIFTENKGPKDEVSEIQPCPFITSETSNQCQVSDQGVARRASALMDKTIASVPNAVSTILHPTRRSSVAEMYEKAKICQVKIKRSLFAQYTFEYLFYLTIIATVYFVFVGMPLWKGAVWYIYIVFMRYLFVPAGTAVFLGIGFLYAYLPLLISLEKSAPERFMLSPHPRGKPRCAKERNDTALLIPCYKSESLIGNTIEAALKIFPAENIFIIANGNSPTPLDDTAAVCERYGVSHTWSPLGSKIIAQFVGTYVAKKFPYVLLIDDDCLLPPNFPLVTERLRGNVQCIGYTIKSVGPNRSKGTLCQQAQDMEYKLSGIQRAFAGKVGSATFPHGAISIWDRDLLMKTFQEHPGFSVSEDWFFGHVARQLGCRIQMCTSVFVETETPSAIFHSRGGARGGFGEMTIWKQRFFRWNFFFVNGMYYNMLYILKDWHLGWWEFGAKLFVFQEVYETLLYLLAPFVLPISFIVRPEFSSYLFAATLALYFINVIIFNYVHLRSRGESVSVLCLLYYMPYKTILTFVNIASCYYSIYRYAKYFAKRHAKVVEDEHAVAIVLKLEEQAQRVSRGEDDMAYTGDRPRHYSITAVGTNLDSTLGVAPSNDPPDIKTEGVQVVDFETNAYPRMIASPGLLLHGDEPSASRFSQPRSSPRQSPSLDHTKYSLFPSIGRNQRSPCTIQEKFGIKTGYSNSVGSFGSNHGVAMRHKSSSTPWPLRSGSHTLSPFSSAWPAPHSSFPAAQPAVPAWKQHHAISAVPEPALAYLPMPSSLC